MAISAGDRHLRIAQILLWFPGIGMLIPTGVVASHAYFSMPIIPMTLSLLMALILLHPKASNRSFVVFLDLFMAFTYVGMIIPYIIGVRQGWAWRMHYDDGLKMLACFATFPLFVVLAIHVYFVGRAVLPDPRAFWTAMLGCTSCPHCQRQLIPDPRLLWDMTPDGSGSSGSSKPAHGAKGGYAKVSVVEEYRDAQPVPRPSTDEETLPRPSTDDEAANLV